MTRSLRADATLHRLGYFESRAKAREAIEAGLVYVDGQVIVKPAAIIKEDAEIIAHPPYPWVSRGGVKLAHALTQFSVDPLNQFCLDVGASTGGFTDVLLSRGARHVISVDVGRDQLHATLRNNARVTSLESQDIRTLSPDQLSEAPTLIVMDASFISLRALLPQTTRLSAENCDLIALIKPQFEAGPGASKKGIIRDMKMHKNICEKIITTIEHLGWRRPSIIDSPITGKDGNREFLIHAVKP